MSIATNSLPSVWEYLEQADLNEEMISSTISSYDEFATNYSEEYEFDWEMIHRTKQDYLHKFVSKLKPGDTVFVVGIGTGRDILELSQRGMVCLGVDASSAMVSESIKNGVRSPLIIQDVRSIHLSPYSFDGILVDSALEHIPKKDVSGLVAELLLSLRIDGVAMIRFRIGKGSVFKVQDRVGERFFTSYQREEANQLLYGMGEEFVILEQDEIPHKVSVRPGFLSIFVQRKKVIK